MSDMPYVDQKGIVYKYGEFFPSEISPFCYNETIAQEYFPLSKEKILDSGKKYRELIKIYEDKIKRVIDKVWAEQMEEVQRMFGNISESYKIKWPRIRNRY